MAKLAVCQAALVNDVAPRRIAVRVRFRVLARPALDRSSI